jgi:hypothetical protein
VKNKTKLLFVAKVEVRKDRKEGERDRVKRVRVGERKRLFLKD